MSNLTLVAEQVAQSRYFIKDEQGNATEDWEGLARRVVGYVCQKEKQEFKDEMQAIINNTQFLPNSPCLVNAGRGTKSQGLLACFVTKSPEDSWIGMVENLANFGHICRQGGGSGVSFSNIRPEGDPVFGSTHAKACGPIEHMRTISEAMHGITQSGFRSMACTPYETRICTNKGLMQIGDIVKQNLVGIDIQTQFGDATITKAWSNGHKEVFEIITQRGIKVKLTGDHLIYVINKYNGQNHGKLSKKVNEIGVWKKVADLDIKHDSLVVNVDPKTFNSEYQFVNGICLDERMSALISYTKCDGSLTEHKGYDLLQLVLDSDESLSYFRDKISAAR